MRRLSVCLVMVGLGCSTPTPTTADASSNDAATKDATDAPVTSGADIGSRCTSASDCAPGLICKYKGAPNEAFPAKGLCTKPCAADDECTAIQAGTVCSPAALGSQKYCLEACSVGPPGAFESLLAGPGGKCHGRPEMACQGGSVSACLPTCNDDSQCDGALCDPGRGVCNASGAGWDDIGSPGTCGTNFGTGTNSTAGPASICTAQCTLGVVPSCRWDGKPGKPAAACIFRQTTRGYGDRGLCGKLCDCDGDCPSPLHCLPMPKAAFVTETGRQGACGTGVGIACASDAGTD